MTSVLTGDIINSRNVNSDEWLPVLKKEFNNIGNSPKVWEIFRGDSFQIEIEKAEDALLFAIKMKAILKRIKHLDVRIAIGIGEKNTNYKNITEGNGEAFINSGNAFDTLLKKQTLAIASPWMDINEIINTSLGLALIIMDNWTTNSADFVVKNLDNPATTQKNIAKQLNISESSASERRKRAGLDEIMRFVNLYDHLITIKLKN